MLTKILILLALAFTTLGAFRWAAAPPRPRWLTPALAGVTVAVLLVRFGAIGILAGVGVAAALWFMPRVRTAPQRDRAEVEARAALGVGAEATEADIRAAHRRKITEAHPDTGGSEDAAARLNAARDLLLRKAASGR